MSSLEYRNDDGGAENGDYKCQSKGVAVPKAKYGSPDNASNKGANNSDRCGREYAHGIRARNHQPTERADY